MKRIISLIILLAIALTLSGCGKPIETDDTALRISSVLTDWSDGLPERFRLRVGSFNIAKFWLVDGDIEAIAEDIRALELDLVGVQEIEVGTTTSDGKDTVKLLAEACGYDYYAFSMAMNYRGGEYGTAVFSKYPISDVRAYDLYHPEKIENRTVSRVEVEINGFTFNFFNTHLSYESLEMRANQLRELEMVMSLSNRPILTGDFNVRSDSELDRLDASYTVVNRGTMVTFPKSSSKYDDIIADECWVVVDEGVVDVEGRSDHNILFAELRYIPEHGS